MKHKELEKAYNIQRSRAGQRGLVMMSFEEWLTVWEDSGKLSQRGRGKGKYCMCRNNDTGNYTPDNVFIGLFTDNVSDAAIMQERGKHLNKGVDFNNRACNNATSNAKRAITIGNLKQGNTYNKGKIWITNTTTGATHLVRIDDERLEKENYKRGRQTH